MTDRLRVLFGSYRNLGASDVTTFTIALARVLEQYSEDIVVDVTDPVTGLPSKTEWPSVKALKDECERLKDLRAPVQKRPLMIEDHGVSDEERARVAAKFRAFQETYGVALEEKPISEKDAAQKRLDEIRGEPLPKLSEEALRKFQDRAA